MRRTANTFRCRALACAATALALAGLLALAGCATSPAADSSQAASDATTSEPVRIASLKGPTTIGLASMIQEDGDAYDVTVHATADEVAPLLASGDIDIALVPANLAATLFARTEGGIEAIDVNTLGVLYALTADEGLKEQRDIAFADLAGRTIYLTGKGTVPEYTVRCLLAAAGLTEADVTLEFRSEPTEVVALLATDPSAVGIVPQPFATAATIQNEAIANVMDLTEQWDALTASDEAADGNGTSGRFVTGVTVARTAFIDEHPELVEAFLEAHRASAEVAQGDPAAIAQEVVDLGIVGNVQIAEQAIPLCNVVCLTGDEMRSALSGYLEALFALDPTAIGGALPEDAFYYLG